MSFGGRTVGSLGSFKATAGWEDLFAQRKIDQGHFCETTQDPHMNSYLVPCFRFFPTHSRSWVFFRREQGQPVPDEGRRRAAHQLGVGDRPARQRADPPARDHLQCAGPMPPAGECERDTAFPCTSAAILPETDAFGLRCCSTRSRSLLLCVAPPSLRPPLAPSNYHLVPPRTARFS